MYILVFILCKLPALINRLCNWVSDDTIFWMALFQATFDSLFGFFESLVYGITKRRLEIIKQQCLCCCCAKPVDAGGVGLHDPLIQTEKHTAWPTTYSSIHERVTFGSKRPAS